WRIIMMDMTAVIQPKSDQWNADDLIGGPRTITISDVTIQGGTEQPVSIHIKGDVKVYRPCKSMSRVLVQAWGPDARAYIGRSMTLYRDPKVKWGGMEVGGIRISHLSDIDAEKVFMLTMTKQNRAPHKVKVLVSAPFTPSDVADPEHQEAARAAARQGSDAFRAWFKANPQMRPSANVIMNELKAIADEADAAMPSDPDTPPI
ncbi:MAG: hypothetical protein ACRC6I_00925, partial [Paracoccaceae bacterium]